MSKVTEFKSVRLTGDQLKSLRDCVEWSQSEMGAAQNFEQSSIANMEAGRRSIPFDLETAKARMIAHLDAEKARMIAHLDAEKGEIERWIC